MQVYNDIWLQKETETYWRGASQIKYQERFSFDEHIYLKLRNLVRTVLSFQTKMLKVRVAYFQMLII